VDRAVWGLFSSAALFIGEVLARPMAGHRRATGLVMGFAAGTLLSAVASELVAQASFKDGVGVGLGFLAGALALLGYLVAAVLAVAD
jgi:zinc transporter, ZIP family